MADKIRVFDVGDRVLSKCHLVAPPVEPLGVRVEIGKGCDGTVVDVRPYAYYKPYAVSFEVAPGAFIEIDVTEDQIVRVATPAPPIPADIPPLRVEEPDRCINHRALHSPTTQYPHFDCKAWHRVQFLLFCIAYGLTLEKYTMPIVVLTLLVVGGSYAHHRHTEGEWSWRPRIYQHLTPEDGEKYVADPHQVERAVYLDIAFAIVASVFLTYHIGATYGSFRNSALLHGVLAGASIISWLAKFIAHEKAVRIFPDYDN